MNLYEFINSITTIIRGVDWGKRPPFLLWKRACTVEKPQGSAHSFSTFPQKGLSGGTVHGFSTVMFRQFPHVAQAVEKKGEKAAKKPAGKGLGRLWRGWYRGPLNGGEAVCYDTLRIFVCRAHIPCDAVRPTSCRTRRKLPPTSPSASVRSFEGKTSSPARTRSTGPRWRATTRRKCAGP